MKPAVAFRKAAQIIEADLCYGCCTALIMTTNSTKQGLELARMRMAELLGYPQELMGLPDSPGYWWPVALGEHDCATPRLIALELAAILSEENAALSKAPKS